MNIVPHIPKSARYTIGARIENKFLDLLELSYASYFSSATRKSSSAYFSEKDHGSSNKKAELLSECIFTVDILKFLVSTAWEGKFILEPEYLAACCGDEWFTEELARRDTPQFTAE